MRLKKHSQQPQQPQLWHRRALYHTTRAPHVHTHTAETRTTQLLLLAAGDRPTSSSSSCSTQQRQRRGSRGGQLRASEPPIVRFMTPCLGGCALTHANARGVLYALSKETKSEHTQHSCRRSKSTTVVHSSSRKVQQQ